MHWHSQGLASGGIRSACGHSADFAWSSRL